MTETASYKGACTQIDGPSVIREGAVDRGSSQNRALAIYAMARSA